MDISGSAVFFLPCTVYCKEPYMVLKAWKLLSQHEVSLLQQNTRAPREEGLSGMGGQVHVVTVVVV